MNKELNTHTLYLITIVVHGKANAMAFYFKDAWSEDGIRFMSFRDSDGDIFVIREEHVLTIASGVTPEMLNQ